MKSKNINRREFLKIGGIFTAAGVLAACPAQAQITQAPTYTTGAQRLQTEFSLTPVNAQTFWLFISKRNNPLGRREIARQLNISPNSLKDHITRILHHVHSHGYPDVVNLNDAVNIAVNILA